MTSCNRLLWQVIVSDPDPEIATKAKAIVEAALPALEALGDATTDLEANLSFEKDNAVAVSGADFVQECAPSGPSSSSRCGRPRARSASAGRRRGRSCRSTW